MGTLLARGVTSVVVGAVGGAAAVVLTLACRLAMGLLAHVWWLALTLPVCGLLTVGLYRALRVGWGVGTPTVIEAARRDGGAGVGVGLAPAILGGTFLTLLGGGSVGKEAAALQLGGSLGAAVGPRVGRALHLGEAGAGAGVCVRLGMAGAFASLLGTPVAAALFVIEVTRAPLRLRTFVPVALAALAGVLISYVCLPGARWVPLAPTIPTPADMGASALVTLACALAASVFCRGLRGLRGLSWRRLDAPWARMLVGGALLAVLSVASGLVAYAGTGEDLMARALAGQAAPWDFALKGLLTLAVLGVGFKGGEIMPILAIGSTLGCALGAAVGADPVACAGIGLVAMFSACTNAPWSAALLGIEAFGPVAALAYLGAAVVAYLLTARAGLYPSTCAGSYRELVASWRVSVWQVCSDARAFVARLRA